jgi:hypothetical protein
VSGLLAIFCSDCCLTSGGGFAGVDVADDDDVDVNLFLTRKENMSVLLIDILKVIFLMV